MNEQPGISRPVLALGLAGLAICVLLVWLGWLRHEPRASDSAPKAAEQTSPGPTPADDAAVSTPATATAVTGELPPVVPVSLAAFAPGPLWLGLKPYSQLPHGTQYFGGIEFWLDGFVAVRGPSDRNDPTNTLATAVIPLCWTNVNAGRSELVQLGSNVGCIHLVGGTRLQTGEIKPLADIVWRYTDGSNLRTPVRMGYHIRDWLRDPYETPTHLPYEFAKAVWHGPQPVQAGRTPRLYRVSFPNPAPAKVIRQLEFVGQPYSAQLLITALTLDPLKPGERPDFSANLEPPDPWPAAQLEVRVETTDGAPVAGAKVNISIRQHDTEEPVWILAASFTDEHGLCRVNHPQPDKLEHLLVSVTHDDHAGRQVAWYPPTGDVIPATYTFKLVPGAKIGGMVVNPDETPISGARIRLYRFWRGSEEINRTGEQPNFATQTVTTDPQGFWQVTGVPSNLLDHIGFEIRHDDYVPARFTVGASGASEKDLLAGTFKTVLNRGLEAHVRVTDEADQPLAGATVWAGGRFASHRQEKKTDRNGQVRFANLNEGDLQFGVLAPGRQPAAKTVRVAPGMTEIQFKLSPGQVIRALVQNEAGEPLPQTRVVLEGPGGGVTDTYEFSTETDPRGRFEWNGAPDTPCRFYFYKAGYEQKRGQRLAPNQDNVVTLRKRRRVQGWVRDATTQQPITKFRLGVGSYAGSDQLFPSRGMKDYADANGAFTLELDEEQDRSIKAEADDYAEKVALLPEPQNGVVQIVLELTPSPALRGVLLSPDGVPVAGGTVGFTTGRSGGMGVMLRNGRLTDSGPPRGKIATTDATGQFTLPSPPESGLVVAAAETGFATAPIQQVRDTGRLVLQKFGRIEGTFHIAGRPVAGQEFMFSMAKSGITFDWGSYKAATDEQGRFTLDQLPAGAGQIVRLVQSAPNSWTFSHNTDVTVEAGRTTRVTLGDAGAVLHGRVRFETPPTEDATITIGANLDTLPVRLPAFQSDEQARAFLASPEWQEQLKNRKHFGVIVGPDGSFTLDSIPPGTYLLNVTASKPGPAGEPWRSTPIARGQITVTVPETASPYAPIPLEEIILKPALTPSPVAR